jgi:hypothetical protein
MHAPCLQLILAESVSSPLPALTSSPAPSVHSLPANEDPCSDLHAASSDVDDGSDECFSRDPTYPPESQVAFTPTLTPLKNKPFAHRSISASSASNLIHSGHKPNVCILTRETKHMGSTITRPHMIPQATKPKDVSWLILFDFSITKLGLWRQLRRFEWLLSYEAGTFDLDSHFNITFSVYTITSCFLFHSNTRQCLKTGTLCLTQGSGHWYQKSR